MASYDTCQETSSGLAVPKPDTAQYKANKYQQRFTSRLVSYREREEFTDVVLKCGDVKLPCHRVVLAAASSYFHAMFDGGFKEAKSDVVELETFKPQVLSSVIDFIYTAEITLGTENVQGISSACDQLELDELKEGCDMFLAERVEPSNCLGMYVFSKTHDLKRTVQESTNCMLQRLDDILQFALNEEFESLDEAHVIEYVSSDDLEVEDEVLVFKFVEKWVGVNPSVRESSVDCIMEHVRLAFCTPEDLCGLVEESPIMQSRKCLLLLLEAKTYHLAPAKRKSIAGERTKLRKGHEQLVLLDGNSNAEEKCWYLEEKSQVWKEFTTLPVKPLQWLKACLSGTDLVISGGLNNEKYINDTWAFSLSEKKWQVLPSMINSRAHHVLVNVGGEVYAVGGYVGTHINQVEKLDVKKHGWTQLAPMKCELACHMAVNCDQHLFVLAGENNSRKPSQFTQAYNFSSGQWAFRADMPKPCLVGSAVYFKDKIYVVGGDEQCCMSYDPRHNTWTIHAQPGQPRFAPAAVIQKGKILLCGGTKRNDVEECDPNTDKWTACQQKLPSSLARHTLLKVHTQLS